MNSNGYAGVQTPTDATSDYNGTRALILALLSQVRTCTLVRVVSVANSGGVEPVGFVDVQPMVNQLNGANLATPHGVLHRLPYFRLQGGKNAVIIDPEPGDIGVAVFADRDISVVSNTRSTANPGSARQHDMSDGIYFGGVLNGAPEQYVQFNAGGITIHSPTKITMSAPEIELSAPTITMNASTSYTVNSPIIALNGSIVQTGGGGGGNVQLQGPLRVTNDIHSDADVTAQTISLVNHVHMVNEPHELTDPPAP